MLDYSTWGDSWGASWGDAWGCLEVDDPQVAAEYGPYRKYREKRRKFQKMRQEIELLELEAEILAELRGKKKRIKRKAKAKGKPFSLPQKARREDVDIIGLHPASEPISAPERKGFEFDVRSYEILLAELEEVRERIEEEEAIQALMVAYVRR